MRRETLVRVADAVEDLMCETGRGTTRDDRVIWSICRVLWIELQRMLRRVKA